MKITSKKQNVCPVCDWMNNSYRLDHPDKMEKNIISLNQAREWYKEYSTICPFYEESKKQS